MDACTEQAYQQRLAELEGQLAQRDCRIAALQQQVAELTAQIARLLKNSATSSKPPSSDIVKPPKPPPPPGGGKIGGQPGHPRHQREPFAGEQIDRVEKHALNQCPGCGGPLTAAAAPPRVIQQIELVPRPVEVVEHQAGAYYCPRCRKVHCAPFPAVVQRGGLIGPELTALIAYLKGVGHASFSTIRRFCRDVLKITISRSQLVKLLNKATAAMDDAYQELRASLPAEDCLNVDETGHKDNGQRWWTWCFRAELYTLFKIDASRGSQVLIEVLGQEFDGVLGCDYFSAYRKYMGDFNVAVQFCLAHLIRDVKFLTTLADAATAAYGQKLLDGLREMFHVIHRREQLDAAEFAQALQQARDAVLATGQQAPPTREAQNLAERFHRHGAAYFCFITTPGIEPTNNLAEQAIRFVVLDRLVTQGTRSVRGRRWCERIWTAVATCAQQGRSVFEYLRDTLDAHLRGQATPSLLPAGP